MAYIVLMCRYATSIVYVHSSVVYCHEDMVSMLTLFSREAGRDTVLVNFL